MLAILPEISGREGNLRRSIRSRYWALYGYQFPSNNHLRVGRDLNSRLSSVQLQPMAVLHSLLPRGFEVTEHRGCASGGPPVPAGARRPRPHRSTTRPTTASPAKPQRRMPSPRISIRPASSGAGRTTICPWLASRWTRSSPTSTAGGICPERPARMRSNASRDLPDPDGPRISTARFPTSTAEAWTLGALAGRHGAGSRTTKRAPATVASPSAPTGPARFSAQMRPPWASMICFEIDSPSPEFCPKP